MLRQHPEMDLDSLWRWVSSPEAWHGAAMALAVALAWAGLLRLARRPDLAVLGAGLGLAAGVLLTLGTVTGSPRQLPERLPLLLLGAAAAGLLAALLAGGGRRGRIAAAILGLAVVAGSWWLAGAPMTAADLRRGAVPLLGLVVLLAVLAAGLRGPWEASGTAAMLLAGLWLTAPVGPWLVLATVALGASLGGVAGGAGWGAAARIAPSLGLGGLIAAPVLARGAPMDWTAAAAPVLGLLAAPALAAQFRARWAGFVAWIVAGGLPLLFTWLQHRGP